MALEALIDGREEAFGSTVRARCRCGDQELRAEAEATGPPTWAFFFNPRFCSRPHHGADRLHRTHPGEVTDVPTPAAA